MLIPVSCRCGRSFQVKAERIGKVGKCPSCESKIVISLDRPPEEDSPPQEDHGYDWPAVAEPFPAELIDTTGASPERKPTPGQLLDSIVSEAEAVTLKDLYERTRPVDSGSFESDDESLEIEVQQSPKQYKVLTQKDKWFTAKFDPESLERAINSYAQQGWVVKAMTTASIPGFGGNREELIILLER